jgi:hypothetical protein
MLLHDVPLPPTIDGLLLCSCTMLFPQDDYAHVPASYVVKVIGNPARKVEHLRVAKLLVASFHFTRVARTVG